jgi:ATP-dependent RNA circularization protein (DNA/RNA ligase family)
VLQLSDDLKKVEAAAGPRRADVGPLTMTQAADWMVGVLESHPGTHLVGVAPTANPYFSKPRIHRKAFIVGDMILTRAGCPLRFDERLRLKEDYDYTCQHLAEYGEVGRIDYLLATFAHRTNRGGAVAVRTPELEQEMIDYLMQKWPDAIKPNPRRPGEVLLRWKP